jgi:integrase
MAGKNGHRSFGFIRKLPSKRYQASYIGPDLARHAGRVTFETKLDAEEWLAAERRIVDSDGWTPPKGRKAALAASKPTLDGYAETWLRQREIKPRTRAHYQRLLDRLVLRDLGDVQVDRITPAMVRDWYSRLDADTPTQRAHAYALLKGILATAVVDDLLVANPARVRGAGAARRASRTEPATVEELNRIVAAIPERYRLMVLLASWCALRFGELIELRRSDLDMKHGTIKVRRAAVWTGGAAIIGLPKSAAGVRTVAIPPHILPAVREHLATMPMTGRDALLLPSASDPHKHMRPATLAKVYYPARDSAGRPDLRFHDLRHTGAVMATSTGASLAEVMARLGHSTPAAAMRYQHAARGRDAQIASALSELGDRDSSPDRRRLRP